MLDLARVVEIHPESNAVDVVMMRDGRRIGGVQVMAPAAGGDFGFADLSRPDTTGFDSQPSRTRDVYAVIGWIGDHAVALGFLFPQVAQCLFADKGRMVYRHGSDVYTTIDSAGNTEVYHPSGTFLRIATTNAHEDLTGKDYDAVWSIKRNTGAAVHVHLTVANAGAVKATLDIDPSGNIAVTNVGNTTLNTTGTVTATAGGEMTFNAPHVTINAPVQINGQLNTSGDTIAGSISLETHVHSGVASGLANTGGPV